MKESLGRFGVVNGVLVQVGCAVLQEQIESAGCVLCLVLIPGTLPVELTMESTSTAIQESRLKEVPLSFTQTRKTYRVCMHPRIAQQICR